jgi:GT2 family glycosyltransferase
LRFAIVTPNLNQSNLLRTALESLTYQQAAFQLALMDGGSTDYFLENIKGYSDLIQYQKSSTDRGQADAINQGVKRIKGNIIGWLNADDYYFPGALETVADCFSKHPDIDVVYGDAIHVSKEGFFKSYFPPIQEFNFDALTRTCFICQPACFIRRAAFDSVGGLDTDLRYTMDWDLWCRLALSQARFFYLPRLIAAVRYYPGTKTLSGSFSRYMELWRIERKYGKRFIPRSWLGWFLYETTQKPPETLFRKLLIYILDQLRSLKGRLHIQIGSKTEKIIDSYGFCRWDNRIEGRGKIEMPWYGKQGWSKIRLRVEPISDQYEIQINGKPAQNIILKDDFLWVDVPEDQTNHWFITIECLIRKSWQLVDFSCQLNQSKS